MNERFIILLERNLNNDMTPDELTEFKNLLESDKLLKEEYREQKRIKEVLNKMTLSNPSKEVWDSYWMSIYNKIERKFAWIAILIGSTILIGYALLEAVEKFMNDNQSPWFIKFGVFALVFGFLIFVFSILREKIFVSQNDKYKEIQR